MITEDLRDIYRDLKGTGLPRSFGKQFVFMGRQTDIIPSYIDPEFDEEVPGEIEDICQRAVSGGLGVDLTVGVAPFRHDLALNSLIDRFKDREPIGDPFWKPEDERHDRESARLAASMYQRRCLLKRRREKLKLRASRDWLVV